MNKQEGLKRIEVQKETLIRLTGWAVYVYIKELIKSLDEPKPVKVPQFVADWIEKCKNEEKSLLKSLLYTPGGVNSWVDNSENQETFARAWLDGYEVEKEKRYIVKIKNIRKNGNTLKHDYSFNQFIFSYPEESILYKAKFTRKELEEAGFGWVFNCEGIEIEEVE